MKIICLGFLVLVAIGSVMNSVQQERDRAAEVKRQASLTEPQRQQEKLNNLKRSAVAKALENRLLDAGFDVQCTPVIGNGELFITGPVVNRVFARHFMTRETVKSLRKAGFDTLAFSNGTSALSASTYSERYDLTR